MARRLALEDGRGESFPEQLLTRLLSGDRVSDPEFDRIFPPWERSLSRVHWTPLSTIRSIFELLRPDQDTKILDVGSGVGKFCILMSLLSDASVTGVEQRPRLHFIAQKTALRLGVHHVNFTFGNAFEFDWSKFNTFYFYNPFQEHLAYEYSSSIDSTIELDRRFYDQYITEVFQRLRDLNSGTKVVTYHGFGGEFPSAYRLIGSRGGKSGGVNLWEKQ